MTPTFDRLEPRAAPSGTPGPENPFYFPPKPYDPGAIMLPDDPSRIAPIYPLPPIEPYSPGDLGLPPWYTPPRPSK